MTGASGSALESSGARSFRAATRDCLQGRHAIRALVFDFDGLTLNPAAAESRAWREIYSAHGARMPSEGWRNDEEATATRLDACRQLERQIGGRVARAELSQRVARGEKGQE